MAPATQQTSTQQAERMNIGQLNALLAPIKLDAAGLQKLGIQTTKEKGATLVSKAAIPDLIVALSDHLLALQFHKDLLQEPATPAK